MHDKHREDELEEGTKAYEDLELKLLKKIKSYIIQDCLPFIRGTKVLSMGYAGVDSWAENIVQLGYEVEIVEGAISHVEAARARYAGLAEVKITHSLFETYTPDCGFNTVIAGSIIEHVEDPIKSLTCVRDWLTPSGRLILTTPNRLSLHRRVGAYLKVEKTPAALNKRAEKTQVIKLYDRYELYSILSQAGFGVLNIYGCFLKPLSNIQMEAWDDELLDALHLAGSELGDYCKELIAICEVDTSA